MAEAPRDALGGKGAPKIIFIITCGMCGQSWQRATAHEGELVRCIFCGYQGHLRLGATPIESGARGHRRIEVWLHAAGSETR